MSQPEDTGKTARPASRATAGRGRRRQVRLALVIEGGVSLAVWMSGLTMEVDLLRRAGAPDRNIDGKLEEPAVERWRKLCDALEIDVVVDIVAGTSAGGLNGALLACATATGRPLPFLRQLWADAAQLQRGKLLRTDLPPTLSSLLDGHYFADELTDVFHGALGVGTDGTVPSPHPVTLLTTATALGPQTVRVRDTGGRAFEVADHRRIYRFRRDPDRRTYTPPASGEPLPGDVLDLFPGADPADFTSDNAPAIIRAARATAGFPAAFEPVPEAGASHNGEHADLTRFRVTPSDRPPAPLIDGGVLDNAPFQPLLAEMTRREVTQDYRRVICYVVANDSLATPEHHTEPPPTDWFPTLTSAARTMSEVSFRQGVQRMRDLSEDVERDIAAPEALFGRVLEAAAVKPYIDAAELLFPLYRQTRVDAGVLNAALVRSEQRDITGLTLPRLPARPPGDSPGWVPPVNLIDALTDDEWRWGSATADRVVRLMLRHLHAHPSADPAAHSGALTSISECLSAIAAVRDKIEQEVIDDPRSTDSGSPDERAAALQNVVNSAITRTETPRVLDALVARAANAYATVSDPAGQPHSVASVIGAALTVEVLSQVNAGRVPFRRVARFDTYRMGPDIECPVLGPIVPPDRSSAVPYGQWKLYGTQAAHFGAFGQSDWREHDFRLGRLDGAAHLVRLLHRAAGHTAQPEDLDRAVISLQMKILDEEGLDEKAITRLKSNLADMPGLTLTRLLEVYRATDTNRETAEALVSDAIRMLRRTGAGTPAQLGTAGDWIWAVLSPRADTDALQGHLLRRIVRGALWITGRSRAVWTAVRGQQE